MNLMQLLASIITLLICVTTASTTVSMSAETKLSSSSSSLSSATPQYHQSTRSTKRPFSVTTTHSRLQKPTSSSMRQHHHKEHNQRSHSTTHLHRQIPKTHTRSSVITSGRTATHPDHDVEIFKNIGQRPNITNANKQLTTRLRRVNPHNYNHNGSQRRGRVASGTTNAGRSIPTNEWAYNTYNIQSNTFGAPPPPFQPNIGKGDDNTLDVEFIGSSNTNPKPDWAIPSRPRHAPGSGGGGYSSTTAQPQTKQTIAPPPLVPARRGYTTTTAQPRIDANEPSPVTDEPFETNIVSRNPYTNDPKEMERRHICVQQRTITMPVKTTEVYVRPMWKHVSTPCQPPTYPNQMCTRVQLVHEQAYRDVIRHKSAQHVTFDCCTGWMRETPHSDACLKPICASNCLNGGSCSGPDTCTCPAGFTGRYCEHDINECKEEKPCDQTCINTIGSYYCKCRRGFVLQSDQQSCKKIEVQDDDAFEARDLENEIDTDDDDDDGGIRVRDNDVTARLHKIERSLANERIQTHELQKSLQATYHVVDTLKSRLNTLEKQQHDLNRLQTNLYDTETRTSKLEGMVNLLMKCRNGPNAYCP